jgi:hypothetical protein
MNNQVVQFITLFCLIVATDAWTTPPLLSNAPKRSRASPLNLQIRLKRISIRNAGVTLLSGPNRGTFFNRAKEIEAIVSMFSDQPLLTIMLGPPSSGKTGLMKHCSELKDADGNRLFHSLLVNLRGVRIGTENVFINFFLGEAETAAQADSKWELLSTILRGIAFRFKLQYGPASGSVELKSPSKNNGERNFLRNSFIQLLRGVMLQLGLNSGPASGLVELKGPKNIYEQRLGLRNLMVGIPDFADQDRPYVLIVDEANNLQSLADTDKEVFVSFQRTSWILADRAFVS